MRQRAVYRKGDQLPQEVTIGGKTYVLTKPQRRSIPKPARPQRRPKVESIQLNPEEIKKHTDQEVKLVSKVPVVDQWADITAAERGNKPLPVFSDYIKAHYPEGKWFQSGYYYKLTPSHGSYGMLMRWDVSVMGADGKASYLTSPEVHSGGAYQTEEYVEIKSLFRLIQFKEDTPAKRDEFLRRYAEFEAKNHKEGYAKYGRFSDSKAVKVKDGYGISDYRTPEEQFTNDVEEGKIKDERGLKLSLHQVEGKPPAGGYLNAMSSGGEGTDKMREEQRKQGYYAGLVVKVTGDDDPELSDSHNTYAVITGIIDPWHYQAMQAGSGDKLILRDEDVKGWIGDIKTDFIGIGAERHKKEIVPIIEKAMRGKIPVVDNTSDAGKDPADFDFHGVARRYASDSDEFEKELKGGHEQVARIRARKDDYDSPADYATAIRDAENWVKAFDDVKQEIAKLGRDEVARRGWEKK